MQILWLRTIQSIRRSGAKFVNIAFFHIQIIHNENKCQEKRNYVCRVRIWSPVTRPWVNEHVIMTNEVNIVCLPWAFFRWGLLLATQSVTELFNKPATVCYLHLEKSTESGFSRFIWIQSWGVYNAKITELEERN